MTLKADLVGQCAMRLADAKQCLGRVENLPPDEALVVVQEAVVEGLLAVAYATLAVFSNHVPWADGSDSIWAALEDAAAT